MHKFHNVKAPNVPTPNANYGALRQGDANVDANANDLQHVELCSATRFEVFPSHFDPPRGQIQISVVRKLG